MKIRKCRIVCSVAFLTACVALAQNVGAQSGSSTVTTLTSAVNFPASAMSVNSNGSDVYVTDSYANEIYQLDTSTGAFTPFASAPGIVQYDPILVDPLGDLVYVTDQDAVNVFAGTTCSGNCPYGLPSMTPGSTYSIEGDVSNQGGTLNDSARPNAVPATSMTLETAKAIGTDSSGNLYLVGDNSNTDVFFVAGNTCTTSCTFGIPTVAGDIYWLAGNDYTGSGQADGEVGDGGPATAALLSEPVAAVVDSSGDLLIADLSAEVVRLIAAQSCSSACPFGLSSMTAGYIYPIAGAQNCSLSPGKYPDYAEGYKPTTCLVNPSTLGFDTRGDLLIGSTIDTNLNLIAASSCASGCPYGYNSLTEGMLYPLVGWQSAVPQPPPVGSPATEAAELVVVTSVSGAAIDHVGHEYLASGSSIYRVTPLAPFGADIRISTPLVAKRQSIPVTMTCEKAQCVGFADLLGSTKVKEKFTEAGKSVTKVERVLLGDVGFRLTQSVSKKTNIWLTGAGKKAFANARSNPVTVTLLIKLSNSKTMTRQVTIR